MTKDTVIQIRASSDAKARWKGQAKASGLTLSEWIVSKLDIQYGQPVEGRARAHAPNCRCATCSGR